MQQGIPHADDKATLAEHHAYTGPCKPRCYITDSKAAASGNLSICAADITKLLKLRVSKIASVLCSSTTGDGPACQQDSVMQGYAGLMPNTQQTALQAQSPRSRHSVLQPHALQQNAPLTRCELPHLHQDSRHTSSSRVSITSSRVHVTACPSLSTACNAAALAPVAAAWLPGGLPATAHCGKAITAAACC